MKLNIKMPLDSAINGERARHKIQLYAYWILFHASKLSLFSLLETPTKHI